MQRIEIGHIEELRFEAFATRSVHAWNPALKASASNQRVQPVIRAATTLDNEALAAQRDTSLSEQGRRARIKPLQDALAKAIDDARGRLGMVEREVDSETSKLYAFPPLEPEDAVGAALDAEIRQRFATMVGPQRDGLIQELRDGKQDRILHALLRDPMPSSDSAIAASVWGVRVERVHGSALAPLKAESEAIAWARSAIAGVEHATSIDGRSRAAA